jgi:DNA helicase-2/ATP-dependent DNA helicase PcrA
LDLLKDLNPEQREAVLHKDGPLLIIAGAGTGKTKVITHRIAHLVQSGVKPSEILALTFTDKAASEMEERVDRLLPYGTFGVQISTFHAFGDRILRDNALEIGLSTDFRVLTRPEQVIFFREHLFEFPLSYYRPLGNPTKFIDAILTLISRAKDEDVTPEEYQRYANGLKEFSITPQDENRAGKPAPMRRGDLGRPFSDEELAEIALKEKELAETYARYQELMARYGYLDFGDQVSLALKLLRARPSVLARYQRQFRYIMVDEFQDTNYAQFQLVKLLAQRHSNVAVVGDDDQSIYKFRGAAISNILNFMDVYPDARQVVLSRNYRSTREILDSAYTLITNNNPDRLEVKNGINKRLVSDAGEGRAVEFHQFETLSDEADWVASSIKEKVSAGRCNFRDIAILVRNNGDADSFIRVLNMKGIPNRFSGSKGLYGRPEVRLLTSFLRVMANPDDSISLFHLAISEVYNIDMMSVTLCLNLSNRKRRPLFHILSHLDSIEELMEAIHDEGRERIARLLRDITRFLELSRDTSTGTLLYTFLTETGYLASLTQRHDIESDDKIRNIARFFEIVKGFEGLTPHDRVHGFIEHLNNLIEAGDGPPVAEADLSADAVNILTIHKAKGLEFSVVYMVSLVADRFPSRNRGDSIELPEGLIKDTLPTGDFHLEEERRLFYVGMTRAKMELYLTSGKDYGGKRLKKVSPFVAEALGKGIVEGLKAKAMPLEAIERAAATGTSSSGTELPMPDSEALHLSFNQIDDYETCPLKYKYIHILKVPVPENQAFIYGKALHDAVQAYLRKKKEGNPLPPEDVIKVFERSWKGEGFLSREHEERRLEAGKEALRRFVEAEGRSRAIPSHVEKEFSFYIGNNRISGRWDRVDEDGEIVIIDYKSSEVREKEDADRKAKESLQLSIYAMAYRAMEGRLPDRVELHFLESGITGSAVRDEKELRKAGEKILEVAKGIRAREFTATPGYMACGYCDFRGICPYTASE